MDPLHLIQLHHEGSVGAFRKMEPNRLYLIINVHRICIVETTWFLIRVREDQSDILSDVYEYFPADGMFTTTSEFAVNQRHTIAHLFYKGECLLSIGRML